MVGSEATAVFRARRAQLGLWVLVVVSGIWLVVRVSKLWFGGDDWFILLDRRVSPGPGQLGLFEPHNEHWSTVPILVFRAFDALFGVREYWPYVLLLVVVHLAIVVLLWHVMVRSAIDPWLASGSWRSSRSRARLREPHQRVAGAAHLAARPRSRGVAAPPRTRSARLA